MQEKKLATVVSVAGRTVSLFDADLFDAKLSSRALGVIAGDLVRYERGQRETLVTHVEPRRNCLTRTFSYRDRDIAANLDHLFIVCAVDRLFNTTAIDRFLSIAAAQGIPCTLILNKIDLGDEPRLAIYRDLGLSVLQTSAIAGDGMQAWQALLLDPALKIVALCGISGVGKSTLLNRLIPEADQNTGAVSVKTGQGKQTTTQGVGYLYARAGTPPLIVIDLPGVQHCGVSHLSAVEVKQSFPEFTRLQPQCEYADCMHREEPRCAVKQALLAGTIASSRYESYLGMLQELKDMPDSRRYRRKA